MQAGQQKISTSCLTPSFLQLTPLTLQNLSHLDYHRLKTIYNVNIIHTPTYLSFSQLQNLYFHEARQRNWTHFFWSHQDVLALSSYDATSQIGYNSLYNNSVTDLCKAPLPQDWGIRFYSYDHLALVSVAEFDSAGGWDTSIPYCPSDCDRYSCLAMTGYRNPAVETGKIFDVVTTLADLLQLYQVGKPGTSSYTSLYNTLSKMSMEKNRKGGQRNTWQRWEKGQESVMEMIALGRRTYQKKMEDGRVSSRCA